MNKIYLSIVGALIVGLFANCGKKDDDHNGASEMASTCYLMQTSAVGTNPAQSGQCNYNYAAAGFSNATNINNGYGQGAGQYGYTAGYSGYGGAYGQPTTPTCSTSVNGTQQMLVYSNSKGIGCVDTSRLFMSGQVATYDLNRTTMNFSVVPTPATLYSNNPYAYQNQYANSGYNSGYNTGYANSAYSTLSPTMVLRVCDANETCASGQTCRSPFGPTPQIASPIGVCYYN
jgi:hypothetical protein